MPDEALILKRNPDARYTESYNVLFEGRHVGRIYKAVSHAPRESPLLLSPSGLDLQALVALSEKERPPRRRSCRNSIKSFDQAAAFRFLRQLRKPSAPRPVAKRGSVVGSGTTDH